MQLHVICGIITPWVWMCRLHAIINAGLCILLLSHQDKQIIQWHTSKQVSRSGLKQCLLCFFVSADCSYSITEHVVIEWNNNYNFYLSQLQIRIEMAFGLTVMKWGILMAPLRVPLRNVRVVLSTIAYWHNFCISRRDTDFKNPQIKPIYGLPAECQAPHELDMLGYIPTDGPEVVSTECISALHEFIANQIDHNNVRQLSENKLCWIDEEQNLCRGMYLTH